MDEADEQDVAQGCDESLAQQELVGSDGYLLHPRTWGTDFFPDQGNVLRAVKQGSDVLLVFPGAPAPEWRVYRDTDKAALGTSALLPDAASPSFVDPGAVTASPSIYFYQLEGLCTNDMDCGDLEFCSFAKTCELLPTPGAVACGGGTPVSATCNQQLDVAGLEGCAGLAGSTPCPYCRDNSCYWPMSWTGPACVTNDDCHAGDICQGGLCVVDTSAGRDPCPKTVSISDLMDGRYGAGKEVCIQDVVVKVILEADGDYHVRIGNLSYPAQTFTGFITEPTPQYTGQAGLAVPAAGTTVRCHGMVRWDQGHGWWEMHPVDWYGP